MLALKLFLKKTLSVIKHYWYIPIIIVGIIICALLLRGQTVGVLSGILKNAIKSHQKEVEILEETHTKELKKRDDALKDYQKKVKDINDTFEKDNIKLNDKQKKEIDKIVKENRDDPAKIAEKISKSTGFKVELIKESDEDEH